MQLIVVEKPFQANDLAYTGWLLAEIERNHSSGVFPLTCLCTCSCRSFGSDDRVASSMAPSWRICWSRSESVARVCFLRDSAWAWKSLRSSLQGAMRQNVNLLSLFSCIDMTDILSLLWWDTGSDYIRILSGKKRGLIKCLDTKHNFWPVSSQQSPIGSQIRIIVAGRLNLVYRFV